MTNDHEVAQGASMAIKTLVYSRSACQCVRMAKIPIPRAPTSIKARRRACRQQPDTSVSMPIFRLKRQGGIKVFALPGTAMCAIGIRETHLYTKPVLIRKTRPRSDGPDSHYVMDMESENVFRRLNWKFLSCFLPVTPSSSSQEILGVLIVSCQGYTFELIREARLE